MSQPVTLREALLDPALLDALPGLPAALAHIQATPSEDSRQGRFARDLRDRAAQVTTTAQTPTEGVTMSTTTTASDSDNDDEQRRGELAERAEDEATAVRARVRIEEDRRVQEALRLAGYDAPVSESTRPATPREPSP